MDTNQEVRRRRLARLTAGVGGGLRAVAAQAHLGWESLDQVLKKTELPVKKDGTRSARSLGDAAARQIEAAFALPEGWLDWPFDAVDYSFYSALSDLDKGAAQAHMESVIRSKQKHLLAETLTTVIELEDYDISRKSPPGKPKPVSAVTPQATTPKPKRVASKLISLGTAPDKDGGTNDSNKDRRFQKQRNSGDA